MMNKVTEVNWVDKIVNAKILFKFRVNNCCLGAIEYVEATERPDRWTIGQTSIVT